LLVATLALFGGGNLLASHPRAVSYFRGAVAGLAVGAPVTYQGVRVGEVKSVRLEVDTSTLDARIPVEFEFFPDAVQWSERRLRSEEFQRLVERGLRAKLVSQSLVTGLLAIELGYYPEAPAALVGGQAASVVEIPSVQSDLETLKATLGNIPLDQVAASVLEVLGRVDALLATPELKDGALALARGLQQFETLMGTANERVGPLLGDVQDTVRGTGTAVTALQADLQAAVGDLRGLIDTVGGTVQPLGARVQGAAAAAERTFRQAESTLRTVDAALDQRSPLRGNLEQALANVALASKSLRSFADQLERSPNVLLTGR
jgi:paraquat-inducible protein B